MQMRLKRVMGGGIMTEMQACKWTLEGEGKDKVEYPRRVLTL